MNSRSARCCRSGCTRVRAGGDVRDFRRRARRRAYDLRRRCRRRARSSTDAVGADRPERVRCGRRAARSRCVRRMGEGVAAGGDAPVQVPASRRKRAARRAVPAASRSIARRGGRFARARRSASTKPARRVDAALQGIRMSWQSEQAHGEEIAYQLAPLGNVTVARFFSGAAMRLDGVMFGFMSRGSLFLRVDDVNRPAFVAAGWGRSRTSGPRARFRSTAITKRRPTCSRMPARCSTGAAAPIARRWPRSASRWCRKRSRQEVTPASKRAAAGIGSVVEIGARAGSAGVEACRQAGVESVAEACAGGGSEAGVEANHRRHRKCARKRSRFKKRSPRRSESPNRHRKRRRSLLLHRKPNRHRSELSSRRRNPQRNPRRSASKHSAGRAKRKPRDFFFCRPGRRPAIHATCAGWHKGGRGGTQSRKRQARAAPHIPMLHNGGLGVYDRRGLHPCLARPRQPRRRLRERRIVRRAGRFPTHHSRRRQPMLVLILGLAIFLGVHSIRIVADGWRSATIERIGEKRWKAMRSRRSSASC